MDNKKPGLGRYLIPAVIVIVISLGVAVWLQWQYRDIDQCLDRGGQWNGVKRVCERPQQHRASDLGGG